MKSPSRTFLSIAALAVASMGANAVYAYTISTPAGLSPGDNFYLVFVTADTIAATSTDLSTYDSFAQSEAVAGGTNMYGSQAITWEALGTTNSTTAASRFDPGDVPVFLVSGTPLANSTDNLWSGNILNPIDVNSNGTAEANTSVWTGTNYDGQGTVGLYTPPKGTTTEEVQAGLGDDVVEYGSTYYTDKAWVATDSESPINNEGNNIQLPIYAFSSELTVPADATGTPQGNGPAAPLPPGAEMTVAGAALLALQAAAGRLKSRMQ